MGARRVAAFPAPGVLRRNLLLVVQAALTLAIDDPDAERIERRHVELAIAEASG